jgi:predicted flap endonuclease-1-like 5' DNA nuclease
MSDDLLNVARQRADKKLTKAVSDLIAAATNIATEHGIPEGISGHSPAELLGRVAYVQSLSRELRVTAVQHLARIELERMTAAPELPLVEHDTPPDPPRETATWNEPTPPQPDPPSPALALIELPGIGPAAASALREAGFVTVGDVLNVPDEFLLKLDRVGPKAVAAMRTAIAGRGAE